MTFIDCAFDKNKIFYVYDKAYYDTKYRIKPKYLDYIDSYGKYWLRDIIPNAEMFINGKPWYEVKQITQVKTQAEYDCNSSPEYTCETHFYCDKDMPTHFEDKDWVYENLLNNNLVVADYKNGFNFDSEAKKEGNKWVLTHKFVNYNPGDWYKRVRYSAESYTPDKCFVAFEDCNKALDVYTFIFRTASDMSDEDYSLMEACRILKRKGFNAEQRYKYLEVLKKMDNLDSLEVDVRDGRVYVSDISYNAKQSLKNKYVPYPEYTEEIKRSPKKHREWVEECKRIDYEINWYIGRQELVI